MSSLTLLSKNSLLSENIHRVFVPKKYCYLAYFIINLDLGGSILPFPHPLGAGGRPGVAGTVGSRDDELGVEERGPAQVAAEHHHHLQTGWHVKNSGGRMARQ